MMKYAVVFPGQGSQSKGMLSVLAGAFPQVQNCFTAASEVLGYDLWALVQQDVDNKLNKTEYTQPAMLAAAAAVWRVWQDQAIPAPAFLAGHSLGEYTALMAAGVLTFSDAIKLVALRGRLMQEAVPEGEGAMAAVLGLEDDAVQAICTQAEQDEVVEAVNFNSPGQVVIAGSRTAVERALALAKDAGAKRALLLPVSVPSHSRLMQTAAARLNQILLEAEFNDAQIPVIQNIDAQPCGKSEAITEALTQQLYSPVLWTDSIRYCITQGVDTVVELGPGKVLSGLCKRIARDLQCLSVETPDDLEKAKKIIRGE